MGSAGIDDELDGAGRLPLRQLGAIGGRGHFVLGADEDESRDVELGVRFVGAWGIEGRRRPERRRPAAVGEAAILSAVSPPCEKPTAAIRVRSTNESLREIAQARHKRRP